MRVHLERIEAVNSKIDAVVAPADAIEQAREAEARGEIRGPLHGLSFTSKDCFNSQGVRTTTGSLIFADFAPEADSTAIRRLKEAGGLLLGKSDLPEFALRAEIFDKVFGRHAARGLSPAAPSIIASSIRSYNCV